MYLLLECICSGILFGEIDKMQICVLPSKFGIQVGLSSVCTSTGTTSGYHKAIRLETWKAKLLILLPLAPTW